MATLSTATGLRRYMRAIGSKSARRSTPVLVYAGERGYALGAHVGNGASVYAGDTATAHAAARGELVPVRAITGGRIDALLAARGELAEVVRAADIIEGGTDSPRPLDMAGAVSVELAGAGYGAAGLSWTARAASRDTGARPILASVLVEAYVGPFGLRPRYVAADNYRLHVYGDGVPAAEHSGLVPYALAEYVAEAIEGATPRRRRGPSGELAAWIGRGVATYYGEGGRSLLVEAQGLAVRVEDTGMRYPDFRAGIIPAAGTHTARVRVPSGDVERGLRRALDVAKLIAARAGDRLSAERATLALGPKGVAWAAITGRPVDDGVALHVQGYAIAPTGSGEATMAAEYVLGALADRHGAEVDLLLHGEYKPVIISGPLTGGASEYMAVIMPLRGVRDSRAAEAAGIEARELVAAGA